MYSLLFDHVTTLIALLFFVIVYFIWQFFSGTDLNSLGKVRKNQEKQFNFSNFLFFIEET